MSIEAPASVGAEAQAAPRAVASGRRVAIPRADLVAALFLFTLAIIPRAAWIAYNDRPPQGLNDPSLYGVLSDIMADGHDYRRPKVLPDGTFTVGEKFAYYPVGFPATVAGLKKAGDILGWGRSTFSVKMMNGVLGALTVVLVYLLAARMCDRRTALTAASLLAIFPSQIYYTGTVLSEPLFTFFFIAAMLVLLWHPWTRAGMPWPRLLAVGVLLSAATMTRGITLVFPLMLLVVWLFTLESRKRALQQTLIVFAGVAVLTVPWSIRNSIAFHTFAGTSTNLGDDLCIGNFKGATGAFLLRGKCFEGFEGLTPTQVEVERNREGAKIALKDVAVDPFRMPGLVAKKAYWLLYKDDDGLFAAESYGNDYFVPHYRRDALVFAANSIYYATGALVLAGGLAFVLSKDVRRLVVMLAMLYILAVPLVFFGDPRFHFPAIPLATVIAAATIMMLWERRERWTAASEPPG